MPLFLCLHNLFWVVLLAKVRWLFVRGIHWIYNPSYYLISDILNLYYHFRKYVLHFCAALCFYELHIYVSLSVSLPFFVCFLVFVSLCMSHTISLYISLSVSLRSLCLFLSVSLVYVGNGFRKAKINYSGVDYRGSKSLSLAIRRDFFAYTKNIDNCLYFLAVSVTRDCVLPFFSISSFYSLTHRWQSWSNLQLRATTIYPNVLGEGRGQE